jgi:hypothetical protein
MEKVSEDSLSTPGIRQRVIARSRKRRGNLRVCLHAINTPAPSLICRVDQAKRIHHGLDDGDCGGSVCLGQT